MRRRNRLTILAALAAAALQACADGSCGDGTNCAVIDPDAGALEDVVTDLGTKPDVVDVSDVVDAPFDCTDAGVGTVCAAGLRCNAAGRCRCGDGRLDEGEQCDDGRNEPGSGCEPDCRYSCGESRPCAPTGGVCAGSDVCDVRTHRCVPGLPRPGGTRCGDNRVCDGTGSCVDCADEGRPCETTRLCARAVISCASGRPECVFAGNLPVGTPCGASAVCAGNGRCEACAEGATCASTTACRTAVTRCATGVPVCTDAGNAAPGTACGVGRVCDADGACVACVEGGSCAAAPCRVASISCVSGRPVCRETGNAPPGSACGANQVCNAAGVCVACVEGAACTPEGLACRSAVIRCATGAPVCVATGNAPALTACPGGVCNGAGTCVRCGDGFIDRGIGEICDDGNTADGDGCSSNCRSVECGLGSRRYEDPATHTCYWRDPNVTGRGSAVASCAASRGHLAIFESQAELDAVYPAMGLGGSNRVWIGLQRRGPWLWDNDVPLSYTGFRSGEPSGDGTCVEWGPSNNFNDVGCSNSRDFVCERPAPGVAR